MGPPLTSKASPVMGPVRFIVGHSGAWCRKARGMPSEAGVFGAHGEAVASTVLAKRGYRIVERNFRSRWGELDVVAYDGATLVFVEVKARRGARFGEPAYAVDRRKQRRLVRLAQQYLI